MIRAYSIVTSWVLGSHQYDERRTHRGTAFSRRYRRLRIRRQRRASGRTCLGQRLDEHPIADTDRAASSDRGPRAELCTVVAGEGAEDVAVFTEGRLRTGNHGAAN